MKWIKCSENLPDTKYPDLREDVFVWAKKTCEHCSMSKDYAKYEIMIASYRRFFDGPLAKNGWLVIGNGKTHEVFPTHWMPLIEGPKDSNEESKS